MDASAQKSDSDCEIFASIKHFLRSGWSGATCRLVQVNVLCKLSFSLLDLSGIRRVGISFWHFNFGISFILISNLTFEFAKTLKLKRSSNISKTNTKRPNLIHLLDKRFPKTLPTRQLQVINLSRFVHHQSYLSRRNSQASTRNLESSAKPGKSLCIVFRCLPVPVAELWPRPSTLNCQAFFLVDLGAQARWNSRRVVFFATYRTITTRPGHPVGGHKFCFTTLTILHRASRTATFKIN